MNNSKFGVFDTVEERIAAIKNLPNPEEKEVWWLIPGMPEYEASTQGRIRFSKRGKKAKNSFADRQGYRIVHLGKKYGQQRVHRLVAMTFCVNDDPENKDVVDHIDGQKDNNRYDNLRWCTIGENTRFMNEQGLMVEKRKGWILALHNETKEGKLYKTTTQAAKELGIEKRIVFSAVNGSRKSYHGYSFYRITDINNVVDFSEEGVTTGRFFTTGNWAEVINDRFIVKLTDKDPKNGYSQSELKNIADRYINQLVKESKEDESN